MTQKLTEPQHSALRLMPTGWFKATSLPLRAADGLCRRMVKKGVLEARSACPEGAHYRDWVVSVSSTELQEYRKVA